MSRLPRKNPKIIERNEKLRKRYTFYDEVKKYKTSYILELLEKEFLPLEQETIWRIISETGYYKGY